MAACLDAATTNASTSNASSYQTVSFTPSANVLLVVFVEASDTVLANPTLTDSLGTITFTLVKQALKNSSLDSVYCFVADQLAAASARTLTFTCTGDAATGCMVVICGVSGMTKVSSAAIRQSTSQANQAAAGTPAPVFGSACLTANPTLACMGNSSSPPGMTAPTSWTERKSQSYSTPTTGLEYVTRDSGFTGTTITWGSTSASAFGVVAVELDASASSNFSQSLSGSVTSTAALTTQLSALHSLSASVTTSASILKAITHAMSASVVSSAAIIKQTAKSLSASVTSSAVMAASTIHGVAMSAATVCSAAILEVGRFAMALSGAVVTSALLSTLSQAVAVANLVFRGVWNSGRKNTGRDGCEN